MVTGVLPLALEDATKTIQAFLLTGKEYVCLMALNGEEIEVVARRMVKPMESAFQYVPHVYIRDSTVSSICHGAELAVPGIVRLSEGIVPKMPIALFTLKDELVALSKALMSSEQMMKEDHGLAAKTVRVIMPAETYPRLWKTKTVTVKAQS